MTFAKQARVNKAIAIEMFMRTDGIVTLAQAKALTTAERHSYVQAAGLTGASADTWNIVYEFYDDYDAGRNAQPPSEL